MGARGWEKGVQMIVCKNCAEAMWSHGEQFRKATVTIERLEELDIPILYDEYENETIECGLCEEIVPLEEIVETL